ncbi:MAG: beta-galactosidase [Chitinophagaceae bacterium]
MKRRIAIVLAVYLLPGLAGTAQPIYSIDVSHPVSHTITTPLQLGGASPSGNRISVNNDYISVNGQPFFPVMGEFHFSRYPHAYWEESILKMKAGGINVIATYVFWILHEPKEGQFDWEGDRDLATFAALCAKHNIYLVVRVGPYGHGEIRNGAIPDWLYGRPVDIRTDDPAYLAIVKRYFGEIAKQLTGKLYKDGGPVIGIQLENEYQHAGSAWWLNYPNSKYEYSFPGSQRHLTRNNTYNVEKKEQYRESGDQHMLTLKKTAEEAGLVTPLYTATGWGYAAIAEKESLPVSAAYAFPSWGNLEPSPFYLFKTLRDEPDYGPVRYNPWQYPSLSAEIGSGIMITNSKRPEVPFNSIAPLMVRNIGSGSNGIGYYMFHGGSTPVQNGQFMSEEPGELPKISYDFQAPIGEFGQVRPSYKDLVPLHFFLDNFGSLLAPMPVILPATNPAVATDSQLLRYSVRSDGNSGFVFLHNYQDHAGRTDLAGLQLSIKTKNDIITIPEQGSFTLQKEKHAILPFNLRVNDILIRYATVQPMLNFTRDGINYHVFVAIDGVQPEFYLQTKSRIRAGQNCLIEKKGKGSLVKGNAGAVFSFCTGQGSATEQFLVIPMSMAVNAYRIGNGILFTKATPLIDENAVDIITRDPDSDTLLFYPARPAAPQISEAAIFSVAPGNPAFSAYNIRFAAQTPLVTITQPMPAHAVVSLEGGLPAGLNDLFLKVDYAGDKAQAFLDGELAADHFYYGVPWEIGLKRFAGRLKDQPLYLLFHAMKKDAACLEYLKEKIPPFGDQSEYLKINGLTVIPEYKCRIYFR